ncbi:MAG TPA: translational GTPase TypA [bacterium]|mgnify:CR=1 FL=1|nr:translational GTPase TypA [bacterium]HPN29381.1 translational GTPase TypA [bacterium]
MKKIKNIAIIAHVDHGKTTLVDAALQQTGAFRKNQKVEERIMDSNDLERERGITIFSKNASIYYKDYKINIVDTPGHSDFGGEVQRIIKMVDSALLLVDAFEGVMPQTKYVLKKSLECGLKPIVVINKIDRANCRPDEVLNMIFDLFVELNATEDQLDFPVVYASSKSGIAKYELDDSSNDFEPLFETIIKYVPEPEGDSSKPFQFLTSAISYDNYLGKLGSGKIHNGTVKTGDEVCLLKRDGGVKNYKITKLFSYEGLKKNEIKEAEAGEIVTIAGIDDIDVGETVADKSNPIPLPSIEIDEPTISMNFMVNNSPFSGREGKYVTSRNIGERLKKELQSNVSLVIEEGETAESFIVKGRGELQLSILIENMRREGYEFQVSKPKVIIKDIDGIKSEPMENVIIDVEEKYVGAVIEKLGIRKGELLNMVQGGDGYTRLEFIAPSRGLIGFRNEFMTDTRGTGIMNHSFYKYDSYKGEILRRNRGVLIAHETGVSVTYALDMFQDRGKFFIDPGVDVYQGMVIGEHNRENDIVINICKTKKLSNMRASGSDEAAKISPAVKFSLEQALEYIEDDELLEITPLNIRMRKKLLNETDRKIYAKKQNTILEKLAS